MVCLETRRAILYTRGRLKTHTCAFMNIHGRHVSSAEPSARMSTTAPCALRRVTLDDVSFQHCNTPGWAVVRHVLVDTEALVVLHAPGAGPVQLQMIQPSVQPSPPFTVSIMTRQGTKSGLEVLQKAGPHSAQHAECHSDATPPVECASGMQQTVGEIRLAAQRPYRVLKQRICCAASSPVKNLVDTSQSRGQSRCMRWSSSQISGSSIPLYDIRSTGQCSGDFGMAG